MRQNSKPPLLIDETLVQALIDEQFPHWQGLKIRAVEKSGHDNRTFRLGDQMSVRLPSAKAYAGHVRIEQDWMPKLAPYLPLPVPRPLGAGQPCRQFPWPWTINSWLEGENASLDSISDMAQLAIDLAGFLNALQSIDAEGAPPPSQDNFYRGGDLSVYDGQTQKCIAAMGDVIDAQAVASVWQAAIDEKWSGLPVWLHGDIAVGNLLVTQGKLGAVIDFGQLAAGDPACDLVIAWTFFSGESRDVFKQQLRVDEATWIRARGWAIWKALLQLVNPADPLETASAMQVIDDIC